MIGGFIKFDSMDCSAQDVTLHTVFFFGFAQQQNITVQQNIAYDQSSTSLVGWTYHASIGIAVFFSNVFGLGLVVFVINI